MGPRLTGDGAGQEQPAAAVHTCSRVHTFFFSSLSEVSARGQICRRTPPTSASTSAAASITSESASSTASSRRTSSACTSSSRRPTRWANTLISKDDVAGLAGLNKRLPFEVCAAIDYGIAVAAPVYAGMRLSSFDVFASAERRAAGRQNATVMRPGGKMCGGT